MSIEKTLGKGTLSSGQQTNQPIYEVIKKNDLVGAFRDALAEALNEILQRLNEIADLYSAIANPALWTWDFASRWDYDQWW